MSMKEAFGEQDPELAGRQGVVRAAVNTFEEHALRAYGSALFGPEVPAAAANVAMGVEASLVQNGQGVADMAAISTQTIVQMPGVEDVRAA